MSGRGIVAGRGAGRGERGGARLGLLGVLDARGAGVVGRIEGEALLVGLDSLRQRGGGSGGGGGEVEESEDGEASGRRCRRCVPATSCTESASEGGRGRAGRDGAETVSLEGSSEPCRTDAGRGTQRLHEHSPSASRPSARRSAK